MHGCYKDGDSTVKNRNIIRYNTTAEGYDTEEELLQNYQLE